MALETEIKKLTAAVEANTDALLRHQSSTPSTSSPTEQAPAGQAPAGQMPQAPTFDVPATTSPATPQTPFNEINGLMAYAQEAYNTMGAEKGAKIQNIIADLGHQAINQIRPDQFADFYQKVEALKAS